MCGKERGYRRNFLDVWQVKDLAKEMPRKSGFSHGKEGSRCFGGRSAPAGDDVGNACSWFVSRGLRGACQIKLSTILCGKLSNEGRGGLQPSDDQNLVSPPK